MNRRLFNALAAISLLLCLALTAAWVRTYYVFHLFARSSIGPGEDRAEWRTEYYARGYIGVISLGWVVAENPDRPQPSLLTETDWSHSTLPPTPSPENASWWNRRGFARVGYTIKASGPVRTKVREVLVPCWLPILPPAMLLTIWLIRRLRNRYPAGCCRQCGYDLRATPERCPECGAVPAAEVCR